MSRTIEIPESDLHELQKSKDRYRLLFKEMMQGAAFHEMIYNQEGKAVDYRTLELNSAFEAITCSSGDQVIGHLASTVLPEAELKKWLAIFAPVASGNGPKSYRQYSQLNDKFFEGIVFSTEPGKFWVTFSDFTRRRFAEKALQKGEEKWRKLVKTIPDYIALHDLEGRYLYLNHFAEGLSEKKIIGKAVYDFISEESKEEFRGHFERAIEQKNTQKFVFSAYVNARSKRIYEAYLVPIMEKGHIINIMAIATDVTERKKVENDLIFSKNLLEELNKHLNDIREEERAAISREIHDELGQSLTALKLDLNQMQEYINSNPEALRKLNNMVNLISATIKNVQRISSELRPGILDDLGLISAVEWYCDEFERRTGICCKLSVDYSIFDDPKVNLVLFRVLQETLTNVIRHAMASQVYIRLYKSKKGIFLIIHDNGIGIPVEKIESHKSLGLISMRERVKQFGGKISILSGKINGTKLSVSIPLNQQSAK